MLTPQYVCVRKEHIVWFLELGTKSSHFSFCGKSNNYIPVRIAGAENFKLNMKNANCQALGYAITLDLVKLCLEKDVLCIRLFSIK